MSQFHENLQTDGKTDRRTDGQTLFYRTLPVEARGPTRKIMALPQKWEFETRNRKVVVGSTGASLKTPTRLEKFIIWMSQINADYVEYMRRVFCR